MDTLVIEPVRRLGYGMLLLAAALAAVAVLVDSAGRLLAGPAAVIALGVAVRELRGGPLLVADSTRVVVRQGWRTVAAPWPQVERMRVIKDRRAELLEIDIGRTVLLLSRARLGRYPADVLTDLLALRGAGGKTSPTS